MEINLFTFTYPQLALTDVAPNYTGFITAIVNTVSNCMGFVTPIVASSILHENVRKKVPKRT